MRTARSAVCSKWTCNVPKGKFNHSALCNLLTGEVEVRDREVRAAALRWAAEALSAWQIPHAIEITMAERAEDGE